MNSLIVKWIKIVVIRTLREKNLTRLDVNTLISAGMLGYSQCLKRFDPGRGVKFKTYAEYRIKGAVLDEVRKMIGDERCKTKRPRRVDYDMTLMGDEGSLQENMESLIDLQTFLENVDLTEREIEILKARMMGLSLGDIAKQFNFSESRASQIMARVKEQVYEWYRKEMGLQLKLRTYNCPACHSDNHFRDGISSFQCDYCGVGVLIKDNIPILSQDEQPGDSDV